MLECGQEVIEIRQMKKEDCGQVHGLFEQCFHDPWSLAGIEEMFDTPGYYNLVASLEGRICGYVGIKAVLDEADIVNVAVDPSMRRRHIGKKLLQHLLCHAKESAISHIFLEVREKNLPAICLYEQAGFQKAGIRKNYYSNPTEHAMIMVWE